MRRTIIVLAATLLLSGCAGYGTYSLAEQCAHQPGCVTTMPGYAYGPGHVAAIAPQNAGHWEPVVPVRRRK